jgi:2-polyprenyl-3-methyl-5-hydroxy-6-metoxy-1,4-benzoquinol methylase
MTTTQMNNQLTQIYAESLPHDALGPAPNITDEAWPCLELPKEEFYPQHKSDKSQAIDFLSKLPTEAYYDKQVLDYGCGCGFITAELAKSCSVLGYDIKPSRWWDKQPNNPRYSTNRSDLKHGAYDAIILSRVLDVLEGCDPEDLLRLLYQLLKPNGILYFEAQPWTSRYGGGICKAYAHLAFTLEELRELNMWFPHNLKITKPMLAYQTWFTNVGFDVITKKVRTKQVEEYFHGPVLDRIIKINWAGRVEPEEALRIMANQSLLYALRKP